MRTQVAVVGGGPGGATAAMYLRREGLDVLIIEMDAFPRYHIGESMSGECGVLLRELGLDGRMRELAYPEKQGVKVFGSSASGSWFVPVMQRIGDGELRDQFTWQVRRDDFDQMMLDEAQARGARLLRGKAVGVLRGEGGAVTGVQVRTADGAVVDVHSDVVLDISGQKNFLAHQGVTGRKTPGRYDKQIAIFSQVDFAVRDDGPSREDHHDNTLIFYAERYHWAWFIPLDGRKVSVGVVIPAAYFQARGESRENFLRRELLELHPELSRRLPVIRLVEEVRAIPNYSFSVDKWAGRGFACVGDSHRFIDPIFSFGLYLSMKEAQLIAPHVRRYVSGETRHLAEPFAEHQAYCDGGLDNVQDLIDAFWGEPISFSVLISGRRTRGDVIDLFAGRLYQDEPSQGARELRVIAEKARAAGGLWGEPLPKEPSGGDARGRVP